MAYLLLAQLALGGGACFGGDGGVADDDAEAAATVPCALFAALFAQSLVQLGVAGAATRRRRAAPKAAWPCAGVQALTLAYYGLERGGLACAARAAPLGAGLPAVATRPLHLCLWVCSVSAQVLALYCVERDVAEGLGKRARALPEPLGDVALDAVERQHLGAHGADPEAEVERPRRHGRQPGAEGRRARRAREAAALEAVVRERQRLDARAGPGGLGRGAPPPRRRAGDAELHEALREERREKGARHRRRRLGVVVRDAAVAAEARAAAQRQLREQQVGHADRRAQRAGRGRAAA